MNKLSAIGAAVALASVAMGATAEEASSPHVFAANVALTTNYMFRGITQTDNGPAIQGGFDYQYTPVGFYAGAWASNVELAVPNSAAISTNNRASVELDYYGGFAGALANGVGWDIGGIYYSYPGQNEDGKLIKNGVVTSAGADYDYAEVYLKTSYAFTGVTYSPTVKGGVYYSPEYFGEDGDSVYGFGTFGVTLPYDVGLSATVGYLTVDGDKTTGLIDGYDYVHYSIGVSKAVGKLNLNLSWNDADGGCTDVTGKAGMCEGVVFAVSSAW
ncbi:MAG: hypothetical protein IT492_19875 [Gammaproteobacteria bacterium]|nr:hypothetical protein [Gammaproteobacteria bacterium]